MKKFKVIVAALLACLFCFSFASCSNAGYVQESFNYTLSYDFSSYGDDVYYEISFKIKLPSIDNYNVSYRLTLCDDKGNALKNTLRKGTITGEGEHTITYAGSFYSDSSEGLFKGLENKCTLKLSDVSVTKQKNEDTFKDYAIGFGVTGGVILVGAVTLFVILQKKKS